MIDKLLRQRKILTQQIVPMVIEELEQYLLTFTADDLQASKNMWKRYTGRKSMVDFQADEYKLERLQYYRIAVRGSKRYVRKIPYLSVKNETIRLAAGARKEQREITHGLITETLPAQDWYQQTLSVSKLALLAMFIVATGGYRMDEQEHLDNWLLFTLPIFSSYNLKVEELISGERELDGRLLNTTDALTDSVITTFENARLNWATLHGVRFARRRLYGDERSCHDDGDRKGCVELALRGYEPVWKIVPLGRAACWNKCRCYVEYDL